MTRGGGPDGAPRAVTLREVAELAGVSVATASNALSGARRVGADAVERVLAAAEALGYRRNEVARSLRTGSRNAVGVVVPDVTNPFFADLVGALEERANTLGWSLVLCNSGFDAAREAACLARLSSSTDGVLLCSTAPGEAAVEPLLRLGVPVVAADEPVGVDGVGAVHSDNEGGGLLAARHMIARGGRSFGIIEGPEGMATARERVAGFLRGLAEAGLDVPAERRVAASYSLDGGRAGMRELLDRAVPVDAVLTCTDMQAIGAVFEAEDQGRHVPDDLMICGFDGITWGARIRPSLTTILQDAARMADAAFDMLIGMIVDGRPPARIVLPVSLVERESTRRGVAS